MKAADLPLAQVDWPGAVRIIRSLFPPIDLFEDIADPAEADGCDVYFTAGALQYIEEPFAAMIQRLARPPRHLVIQRVPLWKGKRFITLQNNNTWTVPYKIENEADFIKSLTDLGYSLVDHWRLSRSLTVLNSPEHFVENYQGLYLRLDGDKKSASR